ncbi:MAG: hypothetical protein ACI9IP_002280 [Arcticibacterium sp.]|jgi:hypothetical protein
MLPIQETLTSHLLLSTIRMKCLTYIAVLVLFSFSSIAQSITVTGSWYASVPATTVTEAGNDYDSGFFLESTTNQTEVKINTSSGSGTKTWVVSVSKLDVNWDSRFVLAAKRTGDGTGSGLTLGTSYITLTNNNQIFFRGENNVNKIPIQYKLSGISVLIPSGDYSTNVVYTYQEP